MTLNRRLSIFTFALLLLLCTVGATGVAILLTIRPALLTHKNVILDRYGLDDALTLLSTMTTTAVVVTAGLGLLVRRSVRKRLSQFQLPQGLAAAALKHDVGDELDHAAQQLNALGTTIAQLRAKERSEDEVDAARRFTENIIQSMFDVLIVTDPDLKIVNVNRAACVLLEYSELELIGKQIEEIFKEESITIAPPVRQMLKSNSMRDNEMTYRTASGRFVSALVSASLMRDNSGRPMAIITVGKDITARKEIERDLLETKTQAEAANRAKSAFVANMSHEIRTPMTAILGYADLLMHEEISVTERDRCVQTIRRNGQHLLSIINDILDVSKIEAGKMTVEHIHCSPVQIVSDITSLMSGRAADKNLAFSVHYTGAIPHTIQSDPTRLRQILMNLLGNAIKFTEQGGIKLIVGLSGRNLRFDVVDTGVGLDVSQVEMLFRPFVQADSSTTRRFGGTGLGLTISRRLAKMLGGDLTVRSQPGAGSTFSLTIETGDLTDVAMIEKPTVANLPTRTSLAPQEVRLKGRVLLAEDGPDNRVLISFYLREVGLEVTAVDNGLAARDQALEAARQAQPFDLILMDMQMPELDGYEATRQLRAAGYHRTIIALTAHAMGGDREKCVAAGCDDFAVKPIESDKFVALLQRYLRNADKPISTSAAATSPPKSSRSPQLDALLAKPGMSKLVEKFIQKLDDRMSAIRAAAEAHDQAELKKLTHQLKGAAGGYGFPAIGEAAKIIEHLDVENLDALKSAVDHLANLCNEARQAAPFTSAQAPHA